MFCPAPVCGGHHRPADRKRLDAEWQRRMELLQGRRAGQRLALRRPEMVLAGKATGMMFASGWKQIDGKWYYFYTDGTMARAEQLKFLLWKNDNGWQSASNGYKIRNWWDNKINKLLWKGLVQNKCALQREDSMREDFIRKDSMTDHRLRDLRKQVLEPALEHCASCHSFIKGQGSIT